MFSSCKISLFGTMHSVSEQQHVSAPWEGTLSHYVLQTVALYKTLYTCPTTYNATMLDHDTRLQHSVHI